MFQHYFGEFAALLTALFWTFTALAFEDATRKVGTYAVNILRLMLGFIFLTILNYFNRGLMFPTDASSEAWFWLSLSGLVGFVIGDLFLFASYAIVSSRVAMLIMTLVPPMTAFLGWLILGETMELKSIAGMLLVVIGIGITIWSRQAKGDKLRLNYSFKGLLFAFIGAVGQSGGLILSKLGMKSYDAFASTQIRIIFGIFGFIIVLTLMKKWGNMFNAFKNLPALRSIGIGSFFGPFLGVSFSLLAIQHTSTGIASTLMALVPILIIFPSVLFFKQKVSKREIIGAFVSVLGVFLFFI